MKVVALAGGVGGAKLVAGLAKILTSDDFSVIVNTGDDFEHLSLQISPDLDTVCYSLAELANPTTGWGQVDDSWITYDQIKSLGGPDWFKLGDKDLAVHLLRTQKLHQGWTLSEVTQDFCMHWGIEVRIFPMSDDFVRTIVHTSKGEQLGFQEYFVHQACQPVVRSFEFVGATQARPLPEALRRIEEADLIVIAPSNPWVSIDPILAVPGYRQALKHKTVVGVSPIIGGKAVKGPAAKMYQELGYQPSASAVARHYQDLLTGFVFDKVDHEELEKIERWRIICLVTDTLMKNTQDRIKLAEEVLNFGKAIHNRSH